LNLELFIARHITGKDKENFAGPIVRLAIIAIALGISVMIIAEAVLSGFQLQIRNKVIGFGAHIQVDNFDENSSFEAKPVSMNQPFYPSIEKTGGIRHIQVFAYKVGILKTEDQIQGVVLKGVGRDFDWGFFKQHLLAGEPLQLTDTGISNDILISKYMASRLMLKTGDDIRMYFISADQSQPRGRKFRVRGIYETGLEEFDKVYILGDIRHIQKLNNWTPDQVSGFEIFINDFNKIDQLGQYVYKEIGYQLNARTIQQIYPQIFDWLRLMDMNVIIILILMVLVAGITMISTLLILILDRTNMIGILKALGMRNWDIRRIFLYNSMYIIIRGLIWGNAIGLLVCIVQQYFKIVPLDQESYYISYVPANITLIPLLLINAGSFAICMLMLLVPSYIIARISPIKAIRLA
jgi:lipoprotein-releasing system permease protein